MKMMKSWNGRTYLEMQKRNLAANLIQKKWKEYQYRWAGNKCCKRKTPEQKRETKSTNMHKHHKASWNQEQLGWHAYDKCASTLKSNRNDVFKRYLNLCNIV